MNSTTFGENLSYWRKQRGMTQEQLAQKLMVTPQAVSKWEKGSYPDGSLLPKLSLTLNVSLDVLFGLKESDELPNLAEKAMEELYSMKEEDRGKRFMEICYYMLYAFHRNPMLENISFPDILMKETFAHVRTDYELAFGRLNSDQQFMTFFRIPPNGINDYVEITPRLLTLFQILSDEDALKVIFYCESLPRNFIFTKESIAEKLNMPLEKVSHITDCLLWLGIIWKLIADTGGTPFDIYCYTHLVPLTGMLTLATALTHFVVNSEPNIETWENGPFRCKDKKENK